EHVGNIQSIAGDLVAIQRDLQMLLTGNLFDREILDSSDVRDRAANSFCNLAERLLVLAKDLHGDLRVDPRYEFVIAGLNDLRKIEADTRETFNAKAHGIDEVLFGLCGCPLALWFQ